MLHGAYSYLLQDDDGQVSLTHSVSAGLDYALIGPEHAWLHDQGRAEYYRHRDGEALEAAVKLWRIRKESFRRSNRRTRLPRRMRQRTGREGRNVRREPSGRGDKDTDIYRENLPEMDQNEPDRIEVRFERVQSPAAPRWSRTSRLGIRRLTGRLRWLRRSNAAARTLSNWVFPSPIQ